ncbi:MAG: tetratricopeptide repeat protein [Candidatus Omnitrophica bacterium]|nr:tetratricopeptide repeat protein [Candidatus Omnitrophota bacterium]
MISRHAKQAFLIFIISIFALCYGESVFAVSQDYSADQAQEYRLLGLDAQKLENYDLALSYYQKALELNPKFYLVYNDIGIIYEAKGDVGQAENYYRKAITIKPDYLSPYTNLACLYEKKGDINMSAKYWRQRARLGDPNDAWTKKAKARLLDIGLIDEDIGTEMMARESEHETISLLDQVRQQKTLESENVKEKAKALLSKARDEYQREQYLDALNDALAAKQYDNTNKQVNELIDKIQKRILIR